MESRRERSGEMKDQNDSQKRERWEGGYEDLEESGIEKLRESGKHRSKDRSKSSRKDDKDHNRSKERERLKTNDVPRDREKEIKDAEKDRVSSRDRRREDRDDREKDRAGDKVRQKESERDRYRDKDREREKDRRDRGKEKDHERDRDTEKDSERGRDKERGKERSKDREKEREKERDRAKEKEREKHKDKEKEREIDKDREAFEREKVKERNREKERKADQDKDKYREREKVSRKCEDEGHDRSKDVRRDDKVIFAGEDGQDKDTVKQAKAYDNDENDARTVRHATNAEFESESPAMELEDRILKMKEERLKNKSENASEVLAWVSRSRKLEEKKSAEKGKALQLSKIFEEQDNINQGESEDEATAQHTYHDLGGVKVLHGLDKVIDGGAVVLTLKDQSILADGDVNDEVDMLENVEIGEQKRRDDAYKAAKKKTGIYDDKFNDEPGSEKKILPQYDDPATDEGVTLDSSGHFTGEAEKKLEELRQRIQGVSTNKHSEDLNLSGKISSDYYTHEEMLKFKKPKKKKSLRKKEKLDIDALEAEAVSAGLGVGNLGSRNDGKRQALKEEQERFEAEMRSNAYKSAYVKAEEASKALRLEQTLTVQVEEDDAFFGDDDEDLRKSLERARKLALEKQNEAKLSGPQAIALLASSTASNSTADNQNPTSGESQENKVVFTEMEEFVWGLQLDEESHNPDGDDVFMDEDVAPKVSDQERQDEDGGWTEVKETGKDETPVKKDEEEIAPDEITHEVSVGKGLSGALQLLKERGTLKESIEWGGRNMDKKKSKLVGIYDDDKTREIRIERTDEYGRILTPKEAFRLLSHKFHGKGPGKMKQEKRMREYQEELKIKQMKNADTPSSSVERMIEAQARLKTPYLVLSGHVKPGQTSDPRSGFATVEKELPGGLTPMLGDRKVEHFLGIKRKADPGDMAPPKKPKT